jgi:hypothetical protein
MPSRKQGLTRMELLSTFIKFKQLIINNVKINLIR